MNEQAWQLEQFERYRPHLQAVAYRMLGSVSEADDALQEAWLRLSRADTDGVANLGGWLTTVVGRVCLDMLRSRRSRQRGLRRQLAARADRQPRRAKRIPSRRRCSPTPSASRCSWCSRRSRPRSGSRSCCTTCSACRSRRSPRSSTARRRRRASSRAAPAAACAARRRSPDPTLRSSARSSTPSSPRSRAGDFDALLAVLDPDVVFRIDGGGVPPLARPRSSARQRSRVRCSSAAPAFAPLARPALVNGAAGLVVAPGARPFAVVGFTVAGGRIVEIDIIADPDKLDGLVIDA